jgi:hypothetical protein
MVVLYPEAEALSRTELPETGGPADWAYLAPSILARQYVNFLQPSHLTETNFAGSLRSKLLELLLTVYKNTNRC